LSLRDAVEIKTGRQKQIDGSHDRCKTHHEILNFKRELEQQLDNAVNLAIGVPTHDVAIQKAVTALQQRVGCNCQTALNKTQV
jgi:hypothetical protein